MIIKRVLMSLIICVLVLFLAKSSSAQEYVYKIQGQAQAGILKTQNYLTDTQIERLKQDKNLEVIELNLKRNILSKPNDKYYDDQWYLKNIKAPKGWRLEKGRKKVVIAVLDTGVAVNHAELADNIWQNEDEIADNGLDDDNNGYIDDVNGWDFVNENDNPIPDLTGKTTEESVVHGTHVSGIIAAKDNNHKGISGVCPNCTLMPVQVLDDKGEGSIKDIYHGLLYAIDNGADVINLSFGSFGYSSLEDKGLEKALNHGIVVIAAAGNNKRNLNSKPMYPICDSGVLGVGATNKANVMADFSNYGADCVDISAPGTSILSTFYKNEDYDLLSSYGYMEGTSMSAPMVAGLAGLLKSYEKDLGRKKIIKYIKDNASDFGLGEKMGSGVININRSLQAVKKDYTYANRPD